MTAPQVEATDLIWVEDLSVDVVESHSVLVQEDQTYVTVCGILPTAGHYLDAAVGAEGWIYIDQACSTCFPMSAVIERAA